MRLVHLTISIVLVILFCEVIEAQNYDVRHYVNNENLPSNIVFDMEIAPDGFLLFATGNGIVQFNGSKFSEVSYFGKYKNYSMFSIYKHSNQSIFVSCGDNKILVAHPDSSIYHISYKTGDYRFSNVFEHNHQLISYYNNFIYFIYPNKNKYIIDTQRIILPPYSFIKSLVSFQNKLYAVVDSNLYLFDEEKNMQLIHPELKGICTACFVIDNTFYLVVKNRIYRSSDVNDLEEMISIHKNDRIGNISPGQGNQFYLEIIGKGLFSYDFTFNTITELFRSDLGITFIKPDNSQNIWIGTYGDGVYSISHKLINSLQDQSNNRLRITDIAINPNGKLLIGTTNGLFQYDSMSECLKQECNKFRNQYIWQVNYSGYLRKFFVSVYFNRSIHNYRIKNESDIPKELESIQCADIHYLRSTCNHVTKDKIYYSSWNHFLSYNNYTLNKRLIKITYTEYKQNVLPSPDIRTKIIFQDTNTLLIGCNLGLYSIKNMDKEEIDKISTENILQIKKD
ncbi:MAG: hypothetical protein H8E61_09875, partial [Bacteroidetes bacterium]|nr:hypothetical protein [Bacteroidota bacterium]